MNSDSQIFNAHKRDRIQGLILFTLIFCAFISYWYGPFLGSLNQCFFNGAGDGLKSYYNVTYHAKYGGSLFQHQGMSYPYGEYLFLEDSMPLLSIFLKMLIRISPIAGEYTVGIINVLFFLSLFAGAILLYYLLVKLNVDTIPAAIAANAILFLSSQNILLFPAGHLALTYSAFFISGWYLLIKYFESDDRRKWSLVIVVNIIFWTFIHAYLGLILLMFTLAAHLIYPFVMRFYQHRKSFNYFWPAIQVAAPLLVFIIFYKVLDQHPDRIDMPFIETHRSTLTSVFIPAVSPLREFFSSSLPLADSSVYAWTTVGTYVGMVSIITIIFFVVESIVALIRNDFKRYISQFSMVMMVCVLSSVLLLLFSFAMPFRWFSDSLLNELPYIKQFSSYGRFAWPFYYIITTFSLVFWSTRLRNFSWRKWVIILPALLYFAEAIPLHRSLHSTIFQANNSFNLKYLPDEHRALIIENPQHYQAILPLPAFFVYGLPFSMRAYHGSIFGALSASALSGLPVLSTFLSRPSVSESMNIYKFISPHPYQQNIETITADGRDLAVVFLLSDTANMTYNEKELFRKCKPVKLTESYALYSLGLADLAYYEKPELDTLTLSSDSTWSVPSNEFYYIDHLDNLESREVYLGNGAYEGIKKEWNQIFKIPTAQMDTGRVYTLSYWYYNHVWDQTFNTAIVHETDAAGQTVQWLYYSPIEATVIDGWWYFSEFHFTVKSTDTELALLFNGEEKFETWFAVDEVLLRPADTDVMRSIVKDEDLHIFKNGLLIRVSDNSND